MFRQARKRYEKNISNKSKENPKLFWAHVRQKLKTKTGVAPLLENNADKDSTKFDDTEMSTTKSNFRAFSPENTVAASQEYLLGILPKWSIISK